MKFIGNNYPPNIFASWELERLSSYSFYVFAVNGAVEVGDGELQILMRGSSVSRTTNTSKECQDV